MVPKRDPDPQEVSEDRCFRYEGIGEQVKVHQHYARDYREAKALEVMTAAALNDVVRGQPRMLASDSSGSPYLRCAEPNGRGGRVVVGGIVSWGLGISVNDRDEPYKLVGFALARKPRS